MSTLHAWDCPCGTRNHPSLTACHRCRRSQRLGKAVYRMVPTVQQPVPVTVRIAPQAATLRSFMVGVLHLAQMVVSVAQLMRR